MGNRPGRSYGVRASKQQEKFHRVLYNDKGDMPDENAMVEISDISQRVSGMMDLYETRWGGNTKPFNDIRRASEDGAPSDFNKVADKFFRQIQLIYTDLDIGHTERMNRLDNLFKSAEFKAHAKQAREIRRAQRIRQGIADDIERRASPEFRKTIEQIHPRGWDGFAFDLQSGLGHLKPNVLESLQSLSKKASQGRLGASTFDKMVEKQMVKVIEAGKAQEKISERAKGPTR